MSAEIHGWNVPYSISVYRDQTKRGADHLTRNGQRAISACMEADAAAMRRQMLLSSFSLFVLG